MKIKLNSSLTVTLEYDTAAGVDIDIAAFNVTGGYVPRLISDSGFYYYDNTGSAGGGKVSYREEAIKSPTPTTIHRSIRANSRYFDTMDREKLVIVAAIYRAEDRKQTFSSLPVKLKIIADREEHVIRLDEEYPHHAALQIGHLWDKGFEYLGYPANVDFRSYLGLFRPSAKVIY